MDEPAVARLLALLDTGSSRHTLRPLPGSFSNTSVTGRAVPNLALWELAAAVRFIEDPAGMIPEWQQFGPVDYSPAVVQQRFDQFVANALARL